MPRGKITPKNGIEYLSVLDAKGNLDEILEPRLDGKELLALHRAMLLTRRFDERLLSLQRQGKIGTFAPVKGQEAAQLGAVAVLRQSDWLVPAFRETAALIWRGTPLEGIFLYNAGFNEGGRIPDRKNDLPIAIPVASQIPHAVGIAYGMKYREKDDVAMTFFGDGATSEGDFHEAMNFAAVFRTPTIFVCQNNQWAISVPRDRQTKSATLAQKALAYGMPGVQVDGNDLLAVYVASRAAVDRARAGDGPTLIECVTYRLGVHTTADDPTKYREDEEVEAWQKRDPLPRFQNYLAQKGLQTDEDLETLEEEVANEIDAAWKAANEEMARCADPLHMFAHVYDTLPAYLATQRDGLAAEIAARGKGTDE